VLPGAASVTLCWAYADPHFLRTPFDPAGEWFEPKAEPGHAVEPLSEQRETVVHNLWAAVGIYGALAALSGVAVCFHKVRGNL
jgi:hypothetical protein